MLSIVITARNDNYAGDFLLRLQRSVNSIIHGTETTGLPAELVIVEWNPPEDRPPLAEVLVLPEKTDFLAVRIITVPKEHHDRFGVKIPLIEYTAKNTGIRRARGDYILVTNPDIYFPESFFKTLANEQLDTGSFYRTDRIDVIPPTGDFDVLAFFEKEKIVSHSAIQANILKGTFPLSPGEPVPATLTAAENRSTRLPIRVISDIYTNAAGDFLLASRAAWFAIGGFKESTEYFTGIDSTCCLQMLSLGLRQRVFPSSCAIWHFDHARDIKRLNKDSAYSDFNAYLDKFLDKTSIIPVNDDSWGLANTELPEQDLILPASYPAKKKNSEEMLYRQTMELLQKVPKHHPFEIPREGGAIFLYDAKQNSRTERIMNFPPENPPDFKKALYLPCNGNAHLLTPFFMLPDIFSGVQTLTILLRYKDSLQAMDYRGIIQDSDYSALGEFVCASSGIEQQYKVRIAYYMPEQLIRFVLAPSAVKEYALPVYIRIDTDSYSYAVDVYRELEDLKQSFEVRLCSRLRKLGGKPGGINAFK
ncbi:hypothetical protein FACS189491_09630 [Spirochaetia bacterium]|nr:hypothetical protein FACS189491_09630 [Spirochaetia bacterium]